MNFREFAMNEFSIRGIQYRPNYVPCGIPKKGKKGGPGSMNLAAVINPSRPYQPTFRMGKSHVKSQIAMK
jgi:hypothetical protein